jgi:hypothetical protein
MLTTLIVFVRTIAVIGSGHRAVALENLALRQQLAVLKRSVRRPQLRTRDRMFWVLLANAWRDWRDALVLVQPDTVIRWHREWLRRRWTTRSRYAACYHRARTHLSLAKDAPTPRHVQTSADGTRIVAFPEVGGLHHRYERCAA